MQAIILVGLGLVMGMDFKPVGIIVGIAITVMIGGAGAAASNAFALLVKSEDVMAPVTNMLLMPILLLSGIFLPMSFGSQWLQTLADVIPTKHIVDAVRASFFGDLGVADIGWGVGWTVVLFVLSVWWGISTFRKENA